MTINHAKKKPIAIDLFSGCGGLTVGLKKAGFDVVGAVEIDAKARATYALNHPSIHVFGSDIREISVEDVSKELKLKRGTLDLLAGCPPCQGFSRLRTKNKVTAVSDPRNDLVLDFLRFVRGLLPKTVMLENVPALEKDKRFKSLKSELENLGYQLIVKVLDAAEFSVPQRRKRLILLGSRIHAPKLARSRSRITVRDAIKRIEHPSKSSDALHRIKESRSESVRKIIRSIPKNGGSRSDLPKALQLECHKRSSGFNDVYGRMAWDETSPTITSGCINPSKGRFLHPSQDRTITLREAALLQGFPRRYRFIVEHGKEAIALMIGNALPPPFIAAHARNLRIGVETAGRESKRGANAK